MRDIRNVLGAVSSLYNFLEGSAKRHAKLAEAQQSAAASSSNHPTVTLKRLCETCWSSRYRSVHAVFSNYSAILETPLSQKKTPANPVQMQTPCFLMLVLFTFFLPKSTRHPVGSY